MFVLLEHLVSMGEGMATYDRHLSLGKDTVLAAASLYHGRVNVLY